MTELTDDQFVDSLLRSHEKRIKKIEVEQKKLEKDKKRKEEGLNRLNVIRKNPNRNDALKYLQEKNEHNKEPPKESHNSEAQKKKELNGKRPLEESKKPKSIDKPLPPDEIEYLKKKKELIDEYNKTGFPEVFKKLQDLNKKREIEVKKQNIANAHINKNKQKSVQKTIQNKEKKILEKDINTQTRDQSMKNNPNRNLTETNALYQVKKEKIKEEEDSLDGFIVNDDENEENEEVKKELDKLKRLYPKRSIEDDEDIPEVGFDVIDSEERITAKIGKKEDELEELREKYKRRKQ